MLRIRTLGSSTLAVFLLCGSALAAECTIERDALDDAVEQAPSCAAAYKLFEDCGLGSSADVPLGATVQERCEKDFSSKLDAARKKAYERQLAACDRKYAHRSGTIYLSYAAFCRAGAARDLAKRYAK
jgi:hypothetical protein